MPVDFFFVYIISHVMAILGDFFVSRLHMETEQYMEYYGNNRVFFRIQTTVVLFAGSVFCFIGDEMEFTVIMGALGFALFPYRSVFKALRKGENA